MTKTFIFTPLTAVINGGNTVKKYKKNSWAIVLKNMSWIHDHIHEIDMGSILWADAENQKKNNILKKYLPCRGSQAAIMFLASNICWVNSGTVRDRYCWLPRDVNGANPGMKKCKRGNGTILTANFRKSAFSWPGNLKRNKNNIR